MNDRIQQLINQHFSISQIVSPGIIQHGTVEDLEKFARSIIIECANMIDTLYEAYGASSTAGKFIKNNFGVNEMNKQEVFDFLDALRDSAITNMFGAGPFIQHEFGCSRNEARDILLEWMQSFDQRNGAA